MEAKQRRGRDFFSFFTNFQQSAKKDAVPFLNVPVSDADRHAFIRQDQPDGVLEPKCWTRIEPMGKRPQARCNHAATVVGRNMIVVGGRSDRGKLNDVQAFHLGKMAWSELGTHSESSASQQLPPCEGHSLVPWGNTLLLVGGDTGVPDRVSVWSFDLELENWTSIQTKGEIPVARRGQSVTRAGSILVMFGGEDCKGRKLNDIHVLDLKSLMWLPIHTCGKGPSPRSRHVATMYNDRYLLVFGGASKSKVLNDTYSLDFETMEWSRLKPSGPSPRPRAGCGGAVVGDCWYICGGGDHRGTSEQCTSSSQAFELFLAGALETITLDVSRMIWTTANQVALGSVVSGQDLSLVTMQNTDKIFLVAFGGSRDAFLSNEVDVMYVSPRQKSLPRQAASIGQTKDLHSAASSASSAELSANNTPGLVPLRKLHQRKVLDDKQARQENDLSGEDEVSERKRLLGGSGASCPIPSATEADDSYKSASPISSMASRLTEKELTGYESENESAAESTSQLKDLYKSKLADCALMEARVEAANKEKAELLAKLEALATTHRVTEAKLSAALSELEALRLSLQASELAQEEANSLSNVVHSENMRLERDLNLLKAALDDTQKELETTRGVLSGERTRAFQLQVELFDAKQKLQARKHVST